MAKVVWQPHEKEWLAKRVSRELLDQSIDVISGDPHDVAAAMLVPLQTAVAVMVEDRRREIESISQVRWLKPMVIEMIKAHQGMPSQYPTDILKPSSLTKTQEEPESSYNYAGNISPDEEEYLIPPNYSLVDTAQWNRLLRRLRRNERRLDKIQETLETLVSLWMEQPVKRRPIVVVAGVRQSEQEFIQEAGQGMDVELIFVDPRSVRPGDIVDCDYVIAHPQCGNDWLGKVRARFGANVSIRGSAETIMDEIHNIISH